MIVKHWHDLSVKAELFVQNKSIKLRNGIIVYDFFFRSRTCNMIRDSFLFMQRAVAATPSTTKWNDRTTTKRKSCSSAATKPEKEKSHWRRRWVLLQRWRLTSHSHLTFSITGNLPIVSVRKLLFHFHLKWSKSLNYN